MSMQFILVVPGLLAHSPQTLATAPSLASLQRYATVPRIAPKGLAHALLGAVGASDDTPLAPIAALGAGLDPGVDYVTFADPVLLAADRDDVVLMQRVDDLGADDAAALVATLNRHFAGDGLRFETARTDSWFARTARAPDFDTTPFDVAHRHGLFAHLPRGRDAGTWKRWQNEIEMLLFEHPVNAAREAHGDVPVSGIWFWGGGRLTNARALPALAVAAARNRLGDLARGLARRGSDAAIELDSAASTTRVLERAAAAGRSNVLVVADAVHRAATLADLDARWLAPADDALSRRRVESLDLLADGNGTAVRWTITPPGFWQRVTARTRPFVVPISPAR